GRAPAAAGIQRLQRHPRGGGGGGRRPQRAAAQRSRYARGHPGRRRGAAETRRRLMHDWIDQALWSLDRGQALVLVTVAWAQGSTPREAGAKMLVSDRQQWLTIGGGHLEWMAVDVARKRLHAAHVPSRWIERLPLGPSLGQCCGGMVHLLFERLDAADRGWLGDLRARLL